MVPYLDLWVQRFEWENYLQTLNALEDVIDCDLSDSKITIINGRKILSFAFYRVNSTYYFSNNRPYNQSLFVMSNTVEHICM